MVRDMGNPASVKKTDGKNAATGETIWVHPGRMVMGTIVGVVTKIKIATNGNGDEVETLHGDFACLGLDAEVMTVKGPKADDGSETWIGLESQQLTLPGAWSGLVTDAYYHGGERPVEFAIEVGVTRSDVGMGWTWALNPIVPPRQADAVARLQTIVAGSRVVAQESQNSPAVEAQIADTRSAAEKIASEKEVEVQAAENKGKKKAA